MHHSTTLWKIERAIAAPANRGFPQLHTAGLHKLAVCATKQGLRRSNQIVTLAAHDRTTLPKDQPTTRMMVFCRAHRAVRREIRACLEAACQARLAERAVAFTKDVTCIALEKAFLALRSTRFPGPRAKTICCIDPEAGWHLGAAGHALASGGTAEKVGRVADELDGRPHVALPTPGNATE
eukprot:CAMPEP_0115336324 /NCGR_PEP_ID=MMETSP0270-20121206/88946_1 /TAXON_ID=71861 /ORGANISM="Scrippsiella trochoidea, Strain CCMP3099" /LENGTH=180 /DNA_ID=CAMNT_0002757491 /DNA_START=2081 /DNA_END=2620 /DNA_ORIENTATION=-